MKTEIAQIGTDPGSFDRNADKIIYYIEQAKQHQAELVVFPELIIPGYASLDLINNPRFVRENLRCLERITTHANGIGVIVGFIRPNTERVSPTGEWVHYNSAALLDNGQLVGYADKTLIPEYKEFFERRYFQPGLIRRPLPFRGRKLGLEVCEDLWDAHYPIKVSRELAARGAEILINISASPFAKGKLVARRKQLLRAVRENTLPILYANMVGGFDGYMGELVFDGRSMAYNQRGQLLGLGAGFQEQLISIDIPLKGEKSPDLTLTVPCYDPIEELHNALVLGVKSYFRRTGFKQALLGVSGGIDSAVVAALAVEALGPENVLGISMPSRYTSEGTRSDAEKLAQNLQIRLSTIHIEDIVGSLNRALEPDFRGLPQDVTEENIQARIRGTLLMAEANKFSALLLNTTNKVEAALGYGTLYGDLCGALGVLMDVYKDEVYDLARYINTRKDRELIPNTIITRAPSAELREDQTDEVSLGSSLDTLSQLLREILENKTLPSDLNWRYDPDLLNRVQRLMQINEYKRRQAPPGIKVNSMPFGSSRRIPISHSFQEAI